jgi:hypothetical protein
VEEKVREKRGEEQPASEKRVFALKDFISRKKWRHKNTTRRRQPQN